MPQVLGPVPAPIIPRASHRQVHISLGSPRSHRAHCMNFTIVYAHFSLVYIPWRVSGGPAILHDLIRLGPSVSYRHEATICQKGNRGSRGGLPPTQPLHTLGCYLRVEQCAVLLYSLSAGQFGPVFSTCHYRLVPPQSVHSATVC